MRRAQLLMPWAVPLVLSCAAATAQVALAQAPAAPALPVGEGPAATLRTFYERYLDSAPGVSAAPSKARPVLPLSAAFSVELARTDALCRRYAEGPCGWGADGDAYLDAQELDPALNAKTAGLEVVALSPGRVQVRLNVYPSEASARDFYRRTITYRMVWERSTWVADDLSYGHRPSVRRQLADIRRELLARDRMRRLRQP